MRQEATCKAIYAREVLDEALGTLILLGIGSLTFAACSGAEDEQDGTHFGELTRACGVRDLSVNEVTALEAKLDVEAPDDGLAARRE